MKSIMLCVLLVFGCLCNNVHAQKDTIRTSADTISKHPHKLPIVPAVIITEGLLFGMSAIAADGTDSRKVMGWTYAGCSAISLGMAIAKGFNSKDTSRYKWANVGLLAVTSYGFSRLATYNLQHADNHSYNKKFKRNLLELHATYIVPIISYAVITTLINKKKKKTQKVNTDITFTGNAASLVVHF